jgi:hypothetical protein
MIVTISAMDTITLIKPDDAIMIFPPQPFLVSSFNVTHSKLSGFIHMLTRTIVMDITADTSAAT